MCTDISDVNQRSTKRHRSECAFKCDEDGDKDGENRFRIHDGAATAASGRNSNHLDHGTDRHGDLRRSRRGDGEADASSSTAKAGTGAAAAQQRLREDGTLGVSMESLPGST